MKTMSCELDIFDDGISGMISCAVYGAIKHEGLDENVAEFVAKVAKEVADMVTDIKNKGRYNYQEIESTVSDRIRTLLEEIE